MDLHFSANQSIPKSTIRYTDLNFGTIILALLGLFWAFCASQLPPEHYTREARSQLQARGQYLIKTEPESEDQLDWGQNHHNHCINYILLTLIVNPNHSSMMECY